MNLLGRTIAPLAWLTAFASLPLAGCGSDTKIAVVIVTPDGGDPFYPPDAATQARVTIQDGTTPPIVGNVAADGAFEINLTLPHPGTTARLLAEALADGMVVASGATPPLVWSNLGAVILPVFVQRSESLVLSPWSLSTGRVSPVLFAVPGGDHFVGAIGGVAGQPVDVFDVLALADVTGGAMLDPTYNHDITVLPLATGDVLVVSGCTALTWTPGTNAFAMPTSMPPSARCMGQGGPAVAEPTGGGLLLGGHDSTGAVRRVDIVAADGTFSAGLPLAYGRDHPAAIRTGTYQVLLAGGQSGTDPFLEQWSRATPGISRAVMTNVPRVDGRTGAALVDAGGGIALALGGTVLGSTDLTPDDVVIDLSCLSGGCAAVAGTPVLLSQRRTGAVAALAEGARVVVADGSTPAGVADQVEVMDVTVPRMPVRLGTVGSLPYAGLSMLPLETGSLMIAGGNRREVWFYRH